MDARIGRLNCRCKVLGAPQSAAILQVRLEQLAREELVAEYGAALQTALGDDPSVYVLRNVHSRVSLMLDSTTPAQAAARRWGERAAQATVRTILSEPDGENRVRFEHQADYVAHFIVDLIHDRAWKRWFYSPFRAFRSFPLNEALVGVLETNRPQLPVILGCLHHRGELEPLLTELGAQGRNWLWAQVRGDSHIEQAGLASLLRAAMDLFDRLNLWGGPRPAFEDVLARLDLRLGASIDWRDPQGLAEAMLELARALRQGGYLHLQEASAELETRLQEELQALDWLDTDHLAMGLVAVLRPLDKVTFDLPVPLVFSLAGRQLTPRQRQIFQTLQQLIQGEQVHFNGQETEQNALRLYSALVAADESWNNDGLVIETIQQLLEGWNWLRQNDAQGKFLQRLSRGTPPADAAALASLARLGEPGADILKVLLETGKSEHASGDQEVIESECAGMMLLFRALYDAGLPMLYKNSGYDDRKPGADGLILGLCLAWAGSAGQIGGVIDPGLQLLAGAITCVEKSASPKTMDELLERWEGALPPANWQAVSLQILAQHRLLRPESIFLHHLIRNGQGLLIAGDASGNIWTFGELIHTESEAVNCVIGWLEIWQRVSGVRPPIVAEGIALELARSIKGLEVVLPSEVGEPTAETYQTGHDKLSAVLDVLDGHLTSQPFWNLTLTLTANSLLRLWARWLRGFGNSSVPYLLDQFVNRAGTYTLYPDKLLVEMDANPLDIVLEMSGYLSPLRIPWMGDRVIHYQIRGSV